MAVQQGLEVVGVAVAATVDKAFAASEKKEIKKFIWTSGTWECENKDQSRLILSHERDKSLALLHHGKSLED